MKALMMAAVATAAMPSVALAQDAKKSITVQTRQPLAKEVKFDGGDSFSAQSGNYVTSVSITDGSVTRDVSIRFDQFEVPLRLIVSPRRSGNISFAVQGPSFTGCERADVMRVAGARFTGTIDERLKLLIEARRLIDLCSGLANEQAKLVRAYYGASCSLAGDPDTFFAIHRDASERFRALPDSPQKRSTLNDCRGRGLKTDVAKAWELAKRASPAEAQTLIDELLLKVDDPEWQDGFAAARINGELVARLQVSNLKDQQIEASQADDLASAIAYTDKLEQLKGEDRFKVAFRKEGVTSALLERDRDWFESRMDVVSDAENDAQTPE
ncbi:hypothetical protein LY632_05755 [Erythrobacter sp. SDW2]|uniref:hypothetical protein n=1 Tax=Erythrobacter sp. SDW2 TaxID=2907154 RepID=UPI001F4756D8|nr:hypothetical protein [Erythrobacter sp. SDW2]UIP07901.1 hypothetical protein LY632_05755 [Erythrobacter sp. SDW2]